MRLDSYLVENKLSHSRNKAQEMIKAGLVQVDATVVKKPSFKVEARNKIAVAQHKSYVSRAAYKLLYFLDEITLDVAEKRALDIGSSTGGFTQVLLERGVASVSCVDVGREQLHHSLREDARVSVYEGCDIRRFEAEDEPFELVVSDVAFISLLHILDAINRLSRKDIILLFKPQFEVGREAKRDKNGVVLDKKAIERAMQKFEDACSLKGWNLQKKSPSKISGKEGNQEWCYWFRKL
jgi:23S rRNA (cytidine1920-2'-O)/16S rRNA (cytidine1409-2'-O)-methyltransferase